MTNADPIQKALVKQALDDIYRTQSRQIFASLVRLLGDFDLADDALHDAFASAIQIWPSTGMPENPRSWLISTGRFKAIDALRQSSRLADSKPQLARRLSEVLQKNSAQSELEIEDDRLRLIFTCCHPQIDPQIHVPLTLREVCGLTTEEIASAFLTSKATMAQRIVRGKARIRDARIPFSVPTLAELPERLDAVLRTIYLVFNEGYAASGGPSQIRIDLTAEAIRLGKILCELLPDPEAQGLLAMMLLHESRRKARITESGEMVLLEQQDRTLWDRQLIEAGTDLVERALRSRRFGIYTLQAAISAIHSEAPSVAETDWNQIVVLYSVLYRIDPSPVVALNRAVAVAMHDGPNAGLQLINTILENGELSDYHFAHSARAELLHRSGHPDDALAAFHRALELARSEPDQKFLRRRIHELQSLNTQRPPEKKRIFTMTCRLGNQPIDYLQQPDESGSGNCSSQNKGGI